MNATERREIDRESFVDEVSEDGEVAVGRIVITYDDGSVLTQRAYAYPHHAVPEPGEVRSSIVKPNEKDRMKPF